MCGALTIFLFPVICIVCFPLALEAIASRLEAIGTVVVSIVSILYFAFGAGVRDIQHHST